MVIYGDLMVIYGDLWGFNGIQWDIPSGDVKIVIEPHHVYYRKTHYKPGNRYNIAIENGPVES